MWYFFYPVIGAEKDLPICVEGIGLNDIQYHDRWDMYNIMQSEKMGTIARNFCTLPKGKENLL